MLRMPIEDRLKQPLSVLTTWLSIVQPAFEEARIDEDYDSEIEAARVLDLEIERVLAMNDGQMAEHAHHD
jgi:hypothetical protein